MASSNSVRAKAALFGSLGGSSTPVTLPPTSSSGSADHSISLPLRSPSAVPLHVDPGHLSPATSLQYKSGASDQAAMYNLPSRRKSPAGDSSVSKDEVPPAVPVKPYPPKLQESVPLTPFSLSFADNAPLPPKDNSSTPRIAEVASSSRGPRSRTNVVSEVRSTRVNELEKSRMNREAASHVRPQKVVETQDVSNNRDSVFSTASSLGTGSVVVTTANAVSIQRAAAKTRQGTESPETSSRIPRPKLQSVDKGIGVKTRRKSKDSSTSRRSKISRSSQLRASDDVSNVGPFSSASSANQSTSNLHAARTTSSEDTRSSRAIDRPPPSAPRGTYATPKSISPKHDLSNTSLSAKGRSQWESEAKHLHLPSTSPSGKVSTSTATSDLLDPHSDRWGMSTASFYLDVNDEFGSTGEQSLLSATSFPSTGSATPNAGQTSSELKDEMKAHNIVQNPRANGMMDGLALKESLLKQLMASVALVDTQSYKQLESLEDVEACKRDIDHLEQRIANAKHKLKVQMRVRDAADKLRRTAVHGRGNGFLGEDSQRTAIGHQRNPSGASNLSVTAVDVKQAEVDSSTATKRVDAVMNDLVKMHNQLMEHRQKLLEHHASVLAARIEVLEDEQASASRATFASTAATTDDDDDDVQIRRRVKERSSEEMGQLRLEVQRLRSETEQMQRQHEEEINLWRSKFDISASEHQEMSYSESEKYRSLQKQHDVAFRKERETITLLQEQLTQKETLVKERDAQINKLDQQMSQLNFEISAERNIMQEGQQLFSSFESRLEQAEKRLRDQDERCARLLGKAEGREEMDDLLSRIKAGIGAEAKKKKTAGQDIDGLLDSLSTHIDDIQDELERAAMLRHDGNIPLSSAGQSEKHLSVNSTQVPGTLRELALELQNTQREAEEWRLQAERANRRLTSLQRQSAVSATSTHARYSSRLSTSAWNERRPSVQSPQMRSTAEFEARVNLLERRNGALETELSDMKRVSKNPVNKAVATSTPQDFIEVVQELLCILPNIDISCTDLHEIQEALEQRPNADETIAHCSQTTEMGKLLAERTRSLLFVSRNVVGKALTLDMQRHDLEGEITNVVEEYERATKAIEDLRSTQANQMQVVEASKARERQLEGVVEEMRRTVERAQRQSPSLQRTRTSTHESTSEDRSVQNDSFSAAGSQLVARHCRAGPIMNLSITPSTSKLSFTNTAPTSVSPSSTISRRRSPSDGPTALALKHTTPISKSPRTMMLGMDTTQMMTRIRSLESELMRVRSTSHAQKSRAEESERINMEEKLRSAQEELAETQRELEEIRHTESRQRIELLEELTTLTSDLSQARQDLRNLQT